MASSLRTSAVVFLALLGLSLGAEAQTRVRGTITTIEADALTVNGTEKIQLGDKTEIVFAQPIALADIRAGDFLGVTSVKRDGRLIAYEVRRFPKPLNPGHRPFEGRADQTMTNASAGTRAQLVRGAPVSLTHDAARAALRIQVGPPR